MKIEIPACATIYNACTHAINVSKDDNGGDPVTFDFNGIPITVSPFSFASDLCDIYFLKCRIRELENCYEK